MKWSKVDGYGLLGIYNKTISHKKHKKIPQNRGKIKGS